MPKPNIIFFFSDQQRWDTLGCYGQKLPVTPNLDSYAKKGTRFENAFTCQPVCGPARACLQTGLYASQNGCYRNGVALKPDAPTIAKAFNEAGYQTAYIGKWHLASNVGRSNEKIGGRFNYSIKPVPKRLRGGYEDYWLASDVLEFTSRGYKGHLFDSDMKKVPFKGYRADAVTDFALDFIKGSERDKPFFLFISYIEPHHQNDRFRYEGPKGSKEKFKNYQAPGDLVGQKGDWKKSYPDYLGCCNSLDYNFGRIMQELEVSGLMETTIVFYASDHGSHFKTRNGEYKRSCHDASIRIPLLAFGPGFEGGKTVKNLVSLIDLPPTFLRCAGVEPSWKMSGQALQDRMDSKEENENEIFAQISESEVGRLIRTKNWKYSITAKDKDGWLDARGDVYFESHLYDLKNDPHELNNLVKSPEHENIRAVLAEKIKVKMKEVGEGDIVILPT